MGITFLGPPAGFHTAFRVMKTLSILTNPTASNSQNSFFRTLLVMKFGGNAAAIWQDASPDEVSRRLQSIRWVGPGIASMAIRILYDDWGMFKGKEQQIDVKADVHVMRVFKRTGLTLSESESEAVSVAQELNPQFPAELDWPAWNIGQKWCHHYNPNCPACPLTAVCLKRLH